jgi:hypothetical protein
MKNVSKIPYLILIWLGFFPFLGFTQVEQKVILIETQECAVEKRVQKNWEPLQKTLKKGQRLKAMEHPSLPDFFVARSGKTIFRFSKTCAEPENKSEIKPEIETGSKPESVGGWFLSLNGRTWGGGHPLKAPSGKTQTVNVQTLGFAPAIGYQWRPDSWLKFRLKIGAIAGPGQGSTVSGDEVSYSARRIFTYGGFIEPEMLLGGVGLATSLQYTLASWPAPGLGATIDGVAMFSPLILIRPRFVASKNFVLVPEFGVSAFDGKVAFGLGMEWFF